MGTRLLQPKRILMLSFAVTAAVAVVETVGGILSDSISLVSDAVHMFTDVMAIGLSLFAITMAARSHSGAMTFGYHRAEVMVALANGVALTVISLWVLYEAFLRVMSPRIIDAPLLLLTASIGLAGNLVVMFLLKHHAGKSINIHSAFIHVVYNTISSIAVITTGFIALNTGITIVDPLVAFLIAGLVARSAYSIVRRSTLILLEGAPSELDIREILTTLKDLDGVVDVHDLHVWTISTGMDALSGHVVVRDQMLSESNKLLSEINTVLAERYNITHTTIQMEHEREISFRRTIK
ncbi:MAG: cation diffusion facilitator family transporter [Nitrososphaeraceae archaeon]|nr:cation diffusion facilitator family transporter [Nitrososphaeraceae archaeon]